MLLRIAGIVSIFVATCACALPQKRLQPQTAAEPAGRERVHPHPMPNATRNVDRTAVAAAAPVPKRPAGYDRINPPPGNF